MNTQLAPPVGGSQAPAGASLSGGPKKGTRPPLSDADRANLEAFTENLAKIAALTAEQVKLVRAFPGIISSDIMPSSERHALADSDFRVDKIPMELLREFMARMPAGDVCAATLTEHEAQLIFAYRAISQGCYGEVFAQTSEKRRVKIGVTINGR